MVKSKYRNSRFFHYLVKVKTNKLKISRKGYWNVIKILLMRKIYFI